MNLSEDDEQVLSNMLMELRSQARLEFHAAQAISNPDAKAITIEMGEHLLKEARALHRLLLANKIKGLGPIDY